jgi:uncharacterized protein YheU (UPF0270 family)
MIIPYQDLATATLENLIEEFVTRDGTDYGEYELTMLDKVRTVKQGLAKGELVILFIDSTQSVNIVNKEQLR